MSYDNTNSGSLFKNDKKTDGKHPDYRGTINVGGTDYWLSAWIRVAGPNAKNPGSKFMSLAVTEIRDKYNAYRAATTAELDEDIPF